MVVPTAKTSCRYCKPPTTNPKTSEIILQNADVPFFSRMDVNKLVFYPHAKKITDERLTGSDSGVYDDAF